MQNKDMKKTNEISSCEMEEALLDAWLRLSTSINNSRIVSELSFNESLICNLLRKRCNDKSLPSYTATELCQKTNILKSQMNRTLNALEHKGMVQRERSTTDKRQVFVSLNPSALDAYNKQHENIMMVIHHISAELGYEETTNAIALFDKISDLANRLFHTKEIE